MKKRRLTIPQLTMPIARAVQDPTPEATLADTGADVPALLGSSYCRVETEGRDASDAR